VPVGFLSFLMRRQYQATFMPGVRAWGQGALFAKISNSLAIISVE